MPGDEARLHAFGCSLKAAPVDAIKANPEASGFPGVYNALSNCLELP